ncbi:phospho-N-acetylmuramoyl-pentapeptide-transferase [Philodulcilactobacillus myokoensis]|uniref:Phospho-N-acetylmuramoyl-pentapeptide-transferase n=2 Tax=Philodulcilactobacillus myokoensis TaxID=2929573 RepID=A0A9W6B225_9LACO|nr:phospho-N-acetylmuramoyl-pentapeptide-transferase [Philodulcilactobacillus myokoensis]
MPFLIRYFRSKHEGQTIRAEGPKWHKKKNGTPTMGGFLFIVAIVISCVLYGLMVHKLNAMLMILLFVLILYGLLGMWDDSIKIFESRNLGLRAWQKLLGQIVGGIIFSIVYTHYFPLALRIPGYGDVSLGFFYILFMIFWITGFSNAVNLADGLDGLVSGLAFISFLTYGIIAMYQHQTDVLIFCAAVVGGMLAFFIYNHKPAQIFMGDMGSLALGGSLAAVSILLHHELSLLWIGLVFVIETLSVIIQVTSFKLTGKRVFKMTPIHHHFELMGWSEWKIDIVFWCVALFTSITALMVIL